MNNSTDQRSQFRKFNPGTFQSDDEIIHQFVVRKREFRTVMDVIRGNSGVLSCQHLLAVAPRGRGKTMLLARVAAELRTDFELSKSFLPVQFMEEGHEIFNSCDFWLEALFHLSRELRSGDPSLSRELQGVHTYLVTHALGEELEGRARATVLEAADRLGKQLVLMVENLQALCRDADKNFGWQLRKILQSEPQIVLLATATSRFRSLDDADHAFFELFRVIRLDPLDSGECRQLWRMVTGTEISAQAIRPLQILTAGDPRLLVIICEFARHRSLRALMDELVQLIDDHTEYFRGHLEVLAKTERRVYLALVDLWRPSSTGEVAVRARLDVRTVSTMLGRLVERGAVTVDGKGRRRFYSATQRLYSIYYKLRRERDEAAVVRNLIHFMAVFYSEDELHGMADRLTLEAKQSPETQEGLERAFAEAPELARKVFGDGRQYLGSAAEHTVARTDCQSALATLDELSSRFGDGGTPEVQVAKALLNKGIVHGQLGESEVAISTYDELVTRLGHSDETELRLLVAGSLTNRAQLELRLGNVKAAIESCEEIECRIDGIGENENGAIKQWSLWLKVTAMLLQNEMAAAKELFRSLVDLLGASEDSIVAKFLEWVPEAIIAGVSASHLVAVLTCDKGLESKLSPLLVALRQRAGEEVRAPAEVLEVAKDIRRKIEERIHRSKGQTGLPSGS